MKKEVIVVLISLAIFWAIPGKTAERTATPGNQSLQLKRSKAVPGQLNYQGYLADAADSSAVTATLEMTFRLFDAETKGAQLWAETHSTVEVNSGLFQVLLGSIAAFPSDLFDGPTLWLQTEVGAEVLAPRKPLVSVAYSQKSESADHATTAEYATDAQHAVLADTAGYCPGIAAWTVDGDNVYRTTGLVGIGTASPVHPLDVSGAVNATTYYGDGSNLTGVSGTTDNDWTISGSDIYSAVSGNVGVGTTSPGTKLHVHGASGNPAMLVQSDDSTAVVGVTEDSTGGGFGGHFEGHSHHGGGVYSVSEHGVGVLGTHTHHSSTSPGVYGLNEGSGAGVLGRGYKSHGVYGECTLGPGVYAENDLTGIYSYLADTVWAGYFSGDVHISGQVGIGTTTPTATLTMQSAPGYDIYFPSTGNNVEIMSPIQINMGTTSGHGVGLVTNNLYRMLVTGTGEVGIGTITPAYKLDVDGAVNAATYYGDGSNLTGISGTTDNDWTIDGSDVYHQTGNVGIGTNAPQRQLHIKGANPRILIEAASISPEVNFKNSDDAGPETWALYKHGTTDDFRFYQSGDKVTIQNSTGYVGIGTTDPGMILDVDGHIRLRPGGFANSGIWLADNSAVDQWYLGMTNITMTNQLGFYKDSWLMVIDSSGHVGIGTQGPVNKLDVAGGMAVGSGYSGTSTAPANGMIIEGRVGIGTDSPSIQNKLEVTGGSSYNIYTTWSGVSSGAAISATNSGTGGDAIQVEASGSGRSALWARGSSGIDYTIYSADNGATYAGYFDGDLHFSGTMTGGTKSFLIDHPLDPLNKTLMHYCIESPEPLLVYSGKAKTDGAGRAVVQMPDYFAALTKEDQARINLTPVGRPFLIGAEWNAGNTSFTVYGDPNREVFYTVYADRDDPVMRQLKRPVVAEKGSGYFEKGKLLYPEAYGYSASMGVDYVNDRDSELP